MKAAGKIHSSVNFALISWQRQRLEKNGGHGTINKGGKIMDWRGWITVSLPEEATALQKNSFRMTRDQLMEQGAIFVAIGDFAVIAQIPDFDDACREALPEGEAAILAEHVEKRPFDGTINTTVTVAIPPKLLGRTKKAAACATAPSTR